MLGIVKEQKGTLTNLDKFVYVKLQILESQRLSGDQLQLLVVGNGGKHKSYR